MMILKDFFTQILHIEDEKLVQKMVDVTEIEQLKKGHLLIRTGEQQNYVTFLIEGILRGYLIDIQGREITDCFGFKCGEPAMACHGFGQPAQINIEVLTDVEILKMPVSSVVALLNEYPTLVYVYNQILVDALRRHWEVKNAMYQYSAIERYKWFLENYPGLIDQVNHRYIASFLGITPVTLSRIRRIMREKEEK